VLDYLTDADERWLTELLAECGRHTGRTLLELRERLAEPLAVSAPQSKLRGAVQLLLRLLPEPPGREPAPREVRAQLFRSAAGRPMERVEMMARVARELGVDSTELARLLFSDLAGERRVGRIPSDLTAARLALRVNQELVYGHLKRAHSLSVTSSEPGHALVRRARQLGLICVARASADGGPVTLEVSGPFALFHKTELYGRALASLLTHAARTRDFELRAACEPRGRGRCTLRITFASPIFAQNEPTAFDSRARTRLLRDLAKLAPTLQLVADPTPILVGDELLLPDFELVDPRHPTAYRIELVGFWTTPHLTHRLAQLDSVERYVLCVDGGRGCGEADPPQDPRIFQYKTRIRAAELLGHLRA
jgi:predicted nuclease of restriction endonuclease-like RecB superfamily